MSVLSSPELYIEMAKMVNFMLCVFDHSLKKFFKAGVNESVVTEDSGLLWRDMD